MNPNLISNGQKVQKKSTEHSKMTTFPRISKVRIQQNGKTLFKLRTTLLRNKDREKTVTRITRYTKIKQRRVSVKEKEVNRNG